MLQRNTTKTDPSNSLSFIYNETVLSCVVKLFSINLWMSLHSHIRCDNICLSSPPSLHDAVRAEWWSFRCWGVTSVVPRDAVSLFGVHGWPYCISWTLVFSFHFRPGMGSVLGLIRSCAAAWFNVCALLNHQSNTCSWHTCREQACMLSNISKSCFEFTSLECWWTSRCRHMAKPRSSDVYTNKNMPILLLMTPLF